MRYGDIALWVIGALIFLLCSISSAAVPQMINYQGKITKPSGALVDTTVQMTFTIYDDSTTGNVLWADTMSSVIIEKGIFSVLLGSGNPIPDSVFDGNIRYLGTKVGTDAEMTPRKSMVSMPYAYYADKVDGYHAGNASGQVAVSNGTKCTDLNSDKTDGNHVATVEVSTYGTNYIVNTSWAQIYTYSTMDAVRIKNATPSGKYIRYWYSKNLGTPVEGFLYSGETLNITGLSGGIDIRIASTTIQGDGRHITLLGIIANHIIWGHVIYAD